MPLPDGTLTEDEFSKAAQKIVSYWLDGDKFKPCPSCGQRGILIHPSLISNRSDTLSPLEEHTRMPTVMSYCKNCGHATHYVASILGIPPLTSDKKDGV